MARGRGGMITPQEKRQLSAGSKGSGIESLFGGITSGIQGLQELGGDVLEAGTGISLDPEDIKKENLMEQIQGKGMGMFGSGIGGISSAFGVEPKMLLLIGAAIAAVVIVMVIVK